ncbi:hypothetical protein V1478_007063 [Vespula squamosa]|uniref:Uncharacterized protein n=1 Tax=Vespula squamosa TaxID=30214 RepID=A0ABD2B235_VESSQ
MALDERMTWVETITSEELFQFNFIHRNIKTKGKSKEIGRKICLVVVSMFRFDSEPKGCKYEKESLFGIFYDKTVHELWNGNELFSGEIPKELEPAQFIFNINDVFLQGPCKSQAKGRSTTTMMTTSTTMAMTMYPSLARLKRIEHAKRRQKLSFCV